jgi:hypothetical protein
MGEPNSMGYVVVAAATTEMTLHERTITQGLYDLFRCKLQLTIEHI